MVIHNLQVMWITSIRVFRVFNTREPKAIMAKKSLHVEKLRRLQFSPNWL
jgi:hypothetical protein